MLQSGEKSFIKGKEGDTLSNRSCPSRLLAPETRWSERRGRETALCWREINVQSFKIRSPDSGCRENNMCSVFLPSPSVPFLCASDFWSTPLCTRSTKLHFFPHLSIYWIEWYKTSFGHKIGPKGIKQTPKPLLKYAANLCVH